ILSGLITICIPVVICVLSILILLSPVFMNLEYRLPNFPEDSYGFRMEERLNFGNQTRRYLISNKTLEDLRNLKFDTGDPIYKESELFHLEDVKIVIQGVLKVFWVASAILLLSGFFARSQDWRQSYIQSVARGGWLTTGILGMILFLSIVSFQSMFTNFHKIFFEGDSWLFYYSDTLIRLFPIRFWQDIFIVFGISTIAGGVLLGWLLPKLNWNGSNTGSK
ncbi:MAG: TIGR01906 family membrane protein, partial [Anaerolineales bacterium]|nr:TIGR01906 family membrane protein [Anaerolineales bacterium]